MGRSAITVASYAITVEFASQGHTIIFRGYTIDETLNVLQREELEDEEKDNILRILTKAKHFETNLKEIRKCGGKTQIRLEFKKLEDMLQYMQIIETSLN